MRIRLSREVRFHPAGDTAPAPWRNSWAGWPVSEDLGAFLRVVATVEGEVDAASGYLCDIKRLDQQVLTHGLPLAAGERSAGRLLDGLWRAMQAAPLPGARLEKLTVFLSPFAWLMMHDDAPDLVFFTEQFEFSAAHRLHAAALSDEDNRAVFGKCNNPRGHGHNYVVEVTVCAPPDPASGLVVHRAHLAAVVKREVLDPLDHKHLNEDTVEFRDLNPTVEHITRVIHDKLAPALAPLRLARVRVYETPKTWADYGDADTLRLLA